jgi:hypothetical protein
MTKNSVAARRTKRLGAGLASMAVAGTTLLAAPASASDYDEQRFEITIENISNGFDLGASGAFTNPDGSDMAGPALPGGSYQFDLYANPGDRLSLATMLVQSNDWFFSPGAEGIALFGADGTPVDGDITSHFSVIDAGTEDDQPAGSGADQAPRQAGPNTGASDPDSSVRIVTTTPAVADLIKVTSTAGEGGKFTIKVANVSGDSALPTPLAPGVFAVHPDGEPLFTLGQADRGEGLEALAEDGGPGDLASAIGARTGIATPLAPGVFASDASRGHNPIFYDGRAYCRAGIEGLAEDGDPSILASFLSWRASGDSGVFTTPVGGDGPAPLFPGESYQFSMTSRPGDRVGIATMFVQSNDWFFGTDEQGLSLFDDGMPVSGDITAHFGLFDAGTEADQAPGFGSDQAPRQSGPNTGAYDPNSMVRPVSDNLAGENVASYIKVTVRVID